MGHISASVHHSILRVRSVQRHGICFCCELSILTRFERIRFSLDLLILTQFVSETIRTGTMRVVHIPVKTEETQRLRIKFVLYCPICAFNTFCRKSNCQTFSSMPNLRASRSAVIAEAFLSPRPPWETFSKEPYLSRNHSIQAAAPSPLPLLAPSKDSTI